MIARLWRTHRLALFGFVIAMAALGFFTVRTITSTIYWMDPAHQHQPLAGWMTPRYVAQSYDLPREAVLEALYLSADATPRRISLDTIAAQNGVTLADLQARIDAASALRNPDRQE